jgi:hypothetical protein
MNIFNSDAANHLMKDLPNSDDVLTGKVKTISNHSPSYMYALGMMLCQAIKDKENDENIHEFVENFIEFMKENFPVEYQIVFAERATHLLGQ